MDRQIDLLDVVIALCCAVIIFVFIAVPIAFLHPFQVNGFTSGTIVACDYKNNPITGWKTTVVTLSTYGDSTMQLCFWGDETELFDIGKIYRIEWVALPWQFGIGTVLGVRAY